MIQVGSQFSISAKELNLPNRDASLGTTSNQKNQCPENTAGCGKTSYLSVSRYVLMTLLRVEAEHCHVEELLCHVFALIPAVFLSQCMALTNELQPIAITRKEIDRF